MGHLFSRLSHVEHTHTFQRKQHKRAPGKREINRNSGRPLRYFVF